MNKEEGKENNEKQRKEKPKGHRENGKYTKRPGRNVQRGDCRHRNVKQFRLEGEWGFYISVESGLRFVHAWQWQVVYGEYCLLLLLLLLFIYLLLLFDMSVSGNSGVWGGGYHLVCGLGFCG